MSICSITTRVPFQAILCSAIVVLGSCSTAVASEPPFTVANGLYDQSRPDDLGLAMAEGSETVTVFSPSESTDHFSNGVVMTGFKGKLYCQWQSSEDNEDAPETRVVYSRSEDGTSWTTPITLAATLDDGYRSSGGWWVAGDTLVAYVNVWPSSISPRGGYTEYLTSTDGATWSSLKRLTMADGSPLDGIFEQDPHALPDGRIISAAHFQPGLLAAPIYTDDPSGITGWTRATMQNLEHSGTVTRELEPSWFFRKDSAVIMVFRDQNSTFRRLAAVSLDRGENWSVPVVTDMPDSRSKQSAGNLPDGTAFQVGNPVTSKVRIPLVVSLSNDGKVFDSAFVLRSGGDDLQAQRFTGEHKTLGYSYPKAVVWEDFLYVSYATNKEDVEYTKVPLTSVSLNATFTQKASPKVRKKNTISIITGANGKRNIYFPEIKDGCSISIFSLAGTLLFEHSAAKGQHVFPLENSYTGTSIISIATKTSRHTIVLHPTM